MSERSRVEIIEEVLIYHRNHKGPDGRLTCGCGYMHPLGASIMRHRAEIVDAALTYSQGLRCR